MALFLMEQPHTDGPARGNLAGPVVSGDQHSSIEATPLPYRRQQRQGHRSRQASWRLVFNDPLMTMRRL